MEHYKVRRDGQAPLVFDAELIAESDGEISTGREQSRWHEIAVYRTQGGKYVVEIAFHSRWQGELNHYHAEVVSLAEVCEVLQDYIPIEFVGEKVEGRVIDDIRARYAHQVSHILCSSTEFAETVQ